MFCQLFPYGLVGFFDEESSLFVKLHHACCIHEIIVQEISDKERIEILSAGCDIVCRRILLKLLLYLIKGTLHVNKKSQIGLYSCISVTDYLEKLFIGKKVLHGGLNKIEKVRYLVVPVEALSRS